METNCARSLRWMLRAYVGMNWIKAMRPPICYRNNHLRRQDIDIINSDDMRKSFSNLKKDIKYRLGGKKRAPDRVGVDATSDRISSSASLLQPDSHVATSGHNEEGSRISAVISQARSRDPSPHPEPMPANEGRKDLLWGEVDVVKKEVGGGNSRLDPDVEGAAGGRSSHEVKQLSSPLSVTPILPKRESDGAWSLSPQLLYLTIHLDNPDSSAVPDHMPQVLRPDEKAESGAAANEKKSSWKSTAFATAKLLLRGVRDTADAFGPLKSVAGGLCFILENCEVRSSFCTYYHSSYTYPSE